MASYSPEVQIANVFPRPGFHALPSLHQKRGQIVVKLPQKFVACVKGLEGGHLTKGLFTRAIVTRNF